MYRSVQSIEQAYTGNKCGWAGRLLPGPASSHQDSHTLSTAPVQGVLQMMLGSWSECFPPILVSPWLGHTNSGRFFGLIEERALAGTMTAMHATGMQGHKQAAWRNADVMG